MSSTSANPDEELTIKLSASQTVFWKTTVTMSRKEWEEFKEMDENEREKPFDGVLADLLCDEPTHAQRYDIDDAYVVDDDEKPVQPLDSLYGYVSEEEDD